MQYLYGVGVKIYQDCTYNCNVKPEENHTPF